MDKIEAINAVKRFSDVIRPDYEPLMVVLFGSYASGKQTSLSDIDVAVIVEQIVGDFLDKEAGLFRLRRDIDDRIEPILVEVENDPSGFVSNIMSTGEIIYERSSD